MKVLIIGVNSQDGIYLSQLLSKLNIEVHGTIREQSNLITDQKDLHQHYGLHFLDPTNALETSNLVLSLRPSHIYILAAQSSVSKSFDAPFETISDNTHIVLNVLNAVMQHSRNAKIMNACSSEVFGNRNHAVAATDQFDPISPYGVSKAASATYIRMYREIYGIFAVNLFLFNHESKYRPDHFVTKKITNYVNLAAKGIHKGPLYLGNVDIRRDWGLAKEYVGAMIKALDASEPRDAVICTGHSMTLWHFAEHAFNYRNLNAKDFVEIDDKFKRTHDILNSLGDPNEAMQLFNWKATTIGRKVVERLTDDA